MRKRLSNRAIRNSPAEPPDMAFGVTENATNPQVCEFVIECRLGLCDKGTTDCAARGIKRSWHPDEPKLAGAPGVKHEVRCAP
jgi:hypothetical protein